MTIWYSNRVNYPLAAYYGQFRDLVSLYGLRRTLHLSYKVAKTRLQNLPNDISIEAAGFCNFKCPMCIQGRSISDLDRNAKLLSFDNYKKVIDEIQDFAVQISLYYAGEPTLNRNLPKMIEYAAKKNILTYINTNGALLDKKEFRLALIESGLHRLHFSFDGATKATYEKYRVGGTFEKVLENIRNFVSERGNQKTPLVAMQTIVTNTTIPEFEAYQKLARELGIEKAFGTTYHIDQRRKPPSQEELADVPISGPLSRYREIDQHGYAVKKEPLSPDCPWLDSIYILSDGTVIHCCYDEEAEHAFGNVFQNGFRKTWFEPGYVKWRKEEAKPMKLDLCRSCTATSASWIPFFDTRRI
jgi:radical SAM protein with 4Fe4S-binding SPASM domain